MGSEKVRERGVALTSTLHWFETDLLAREENLTGLATPNREAAAAGRVANQERQRIQRSEAIQAGQLSVARQVGDEKQTQQVNESAKRTAMRPEGGYVDLNLTREDGRRMVFARRQS